MHTIDVEPEPTSPHRTRRSTTWMPIVIVVAVVMVAAFSVTACGDWSNFLDTPGISFRVGGPDEFPHLQQHEAVPFTVEGWHVDQEDLCGSGTVTIGRYESVDGDTISDQEWAAMFDAAKEHKGVAEVYLFQTFECDDGSGSFSTKAHLEYDFDTFDFEGEHDIGLWEVIKDKGTGSYSDLSGSGDVALDWDEDEATYGGDIYP